MDQARALTLRVGTRAVLVDRIKASVTVKLPAYLVDELRAALAARAAKHERELGHETTTLALELWRRLDPAMVAAVEQHEDYRVRNCYWSRKRNGDRFARSTPGDPAGPRRPSGRPGDPEDPGPRAAAVESPARAARVTRARARVTRRRGAR